MGMAGIRARGDQMSLTLSQALKLGAEGEQARIDEVVDCPYDLNTDEGGWWARGWLLMDTQVRNEEEEVQ